MEEDKYEFVLESHTIPWMALCLRALELCIIHDVRPSFGENDNQTTLQARQEAALELLNWAIGSKGKK